MRSEGRVEAANSNGSRMMKIVVIISVVTFLLIFGGVFLTSQVLRNVSGSGTAAAIGADDRVAGERVFADLVAERDRIQGEREHLLTLRQTIAAEEKTLVDTRELLDKVLTELRAEQQVYTDEKERLAQKLAKMYEAMKPAKAAPILAVLDMDVILEIMQRMKEKQAAKILSFMDAGLAAQVSLRMSVKGSQG